MRLMLFRDGRYPRYAFPVLAEYIRPNVCPRKSNSPSGTLQIRVFSSLTVSFSLPMISRSRCKASQARYRVVRLNRQPQHGRNSGCRELWIAEHSKIDEEDRARESGL